MPSTPATPASYIKGTADGAVLSSSECKDNLDNATRLQSSQWCIVISSSVLAKKRNGHAGGELTIYTKLK